MKKLHVCLLIFAISSFVLTQTISSKYQNEKRVIQSNHFSSNTKQSVSYQLDNIELSEPLILILKKSGNNQNLSVNSITAKFSGTKTNLECIFLSYRSLCVIPEVEDEEIKLYMECKQKPCQIFWVLYQPQIRQAKNNNKSQAYGLFTLDQSNNHMVVHITCSDPQIKTFQSDVQVYSESHFERGGSKSQVYILFTNEQKGFIYIDIKEKSSKCAHLNFENVPEKVGFSVQPILDFTLKNSPSSIKLELSQNDITLDCFLYKVHTETQKQTPLSPITFRFLGQPNKGNKQLISQILFTPNAHEKEQLIKLIFKKPSRNYFEYIVQAVSDDQSMTIIDFSVIDSEIHQIGLAQQSYFQLKKDQTIKYKFQAVTGVVQRQTVFFLVSDKTKLDLDKNQCEVAQGCEFILTALQDINGSLKAQTKEQVKQQQAKREIPIYFINIDSTYKSKVKINQKIHLKKKVKMNKVFRININTPNALIYVASPEKCQVPQQNCSEKMGNIHHPIIYNPLQDGFLHITIVPLQNIEIVVTILQEKDEYITLEDGVAFGYTLYEKEQRLEFKYSIPEKKDVNFNLVAPLNNLVLIVENNKEGNNFISTEGFITISKTDIKGLQFTIIVEKTAITKNKQTHFTLLASTQDTVIRLQPTVAHYETIKQETYRQYIFEYSPDQSYTINFYIHNVKQQKIKVMLALSTDRKWTKQKLEKVWIDRESDYIDLGSLPGKLCTSQGAQSCEVFLRLQNQMPIQVDITITLMVRNAIIQLKDGIWQSYSENTLISSAHFYFYPKHKDKNLVLLYHSSISDLRLSYNLWKTDEQSISPLFWPFPSHKSENKMTKINNQVTIDKQIMKSKCWPSCVLLITLYRDSKLSGSLSGISKDFKIMASNYQIQIPQKTRIEIPMKTSQQKEIIIDLKYALSRQSMTIYNTRFFGQYVIFANLYSQKKNRCPLDGEEVSDYLLKSGQNIFNAQDLQTKIRTLGMQNDTNHYMCLSIKSEQNCKFAIEYTADVQNIKSIHMDTFEEIRLSANSTKYYQFEGYMDFDAKIMRKQGFPYLYIKNCTIAQIVECKQQLFQQKDKGKQIISKAQDFSQTPCNQCIYLFKFQTTEPSVVIFHLKSKFSMNELKQNQIITDFISGKQENNYVMTHVTGQPLVIDVHILEGSIQARLTNNRNVNLIKSSNAQKLIHFYVQPQKSGDENTAHETQLGKSFVNPFQFSTTFSNYHLSLTNKQSDRTCTYSITYSSGQSKVYLQDGLITDITLQPKKPFTFVYYRESQSHIYLTISTLQAADLFYLQIQSYYYELDDAEVKTLFNLQKPTINNRKNPNPTFVFLLPPKKHFEIILKNPTQKSFPISISINHQQLIFLPFNHDYPFALHQGQDLNFLAQVNQPGFIEITIRKCDESQPVLSYVNNYQNFIKKQFDNWVILKDQPLFKQVIKVQKTGTFYVNLKTSENEKSRLSINLTFYRNKVEKQQQRAGGKGIVQYQIIDNSKVNISFLPISCNKKTKCSKVRYFAEVSLNLDDLYLQMVCPSTYFSSIQYEQLRAIVKKEIEVPSNEDIITTTIDLVDHISYVGVKAVTQNNQEIYYKPIEVVTFWGQLERTSKAHKITLAIIIIISLCALLCFVRYNARKGYKRIEGIQTQ